MARKKLVKSTRSNYDEILAISAEPSTGEEAYVNWLGRCNETWEWRKGRKRNGDKDWERWANFYTGLHWSSIESMMQADVYADTPRDRITVNETGSTILNFAPFILNNAISFLLKPRRAQDWLSARLQQEALNYEWKQRKMTKQIKRAILDMLIIGHGIIKTGYNLEIDTAVKPDQQGEIEYSQAIRKDAPFVRRIPPRNFLIEPTAPESDLASARWCAEIFYKPLPDVVANSSYDREAVNAIISGEYKPVTRGMRMRDRQTDMRRNYIRLGTLPEDNLVCMFEIWDKKWKKRLVFCDGVPIPLIEKDWPFDYLDGFPYEMVNYIPVPDDIYGLGIPAWIEDQQVELDRRRTRQFEHGRRFNRKYLAVKSEIDEHEVAKLTDGPDGTIIFAKSENAVTAIQDGPMAQDEQILEGTLKQDMARMTGADALLQGGALPSRTTAGEVSTRTTMFQLKLRDRIDTVEEWVEDIATQVLGHIKANRTTSQIVRLLGEWGEAWVEFTSEDIQDDVDVEVVSFSAPKEDPQIVRQQKTNLLQVTASILNLAAQNGQPLSQEIDFKEMLLWGLESFPDTDVSRFLRQGKGVSPNVQLPAGPNGLAQALGGTLSPQQIPQSVPSPMSVQDLRQQIAGAAATGGMPQGGTA
jgi:hypothetical protein